MIRNRGQYSCKTHGQIQVHATFGATSYNISAPTQSVIYVLIFKKIKKKQLLT